MSSNTTNNDNDGVDESDTSHLVMENSSSSSNNNNNNTNFSTTSQQQQQMADMTPGQQRWAHYTKMKKSFVMRNNSMRDEAFTITEEDGNAEDTFQDEINDDDFCISTNQPKRKTSFSLVPGSRQASSGSLSLRNDHHTHSNTAAAAAAVPAANESSSSPRTGGATAAYSIAGKSRTTAAATKPGAVHAVGNRTSAAAKPGAVYATGGVAKGKGSNRAAAAARPGAVYATGAIKGKSTAAAAASKPGAVRSIGAKPSKGLQMTPAAAAARLPGAVRATGGSAKPTKKKGGPQLASVAPQPGAVHETGGTMIPTKSSDPGPQVAQRRRSSPGLNGRTKATAAVAVASLEPATMPGAVAVKNDDTEDDSTGRLKGGGKKGGTSRAARTMRKNSKEGAAAANPRGRSKKTAGRRRSRGMSHTLNIGSNNNNNSLSSSDDDDENSLVRLEDEDDIAQANSTTPVSYGSSIASGLDVSISSQQQQQQRSNVVMDDSISVVTNVTAHSAATIPVRNNLIVGSNLMHDGNESILTTSTMATEQWTNNNRRLLSTTPSLDPSQASSIDTTNEMHDHLIGLTTAEVTSISSPNTMGGYKTNTNAPTTRLSSSGRGGVEMLMVMDDQGHTMSDAEMQLHWEKIGLCMTCGNTQTHAKQRWGPFGTLRRMQPQTVEGRVLKGHCLRCHSVPELRELLRDDSIPIDLLRFDPINADLATLHEDTDLDHDFVVTTRKHSPITAVCASVKFQICCGIILMAIVACSVGLGISLSEEPEPWIAPPPTAMPSFSPTTGSPTVSPTSFEWNVVTEIRKDDVESFGYHVELSSDGTIMAVTSPKFGGGRGRLDLFIVEEALGKQQTWHEVGEPIIGNTLGDELGMGMHLSDDGTTVAVGSPGRGTGTVQIFHIDEKGWSPKGQIIRGPTPLSEFGYSVALSKDGTRILIGAPKYGEDLISIYGMVQAFEFNGTAWVQLGTDMIGGNHASRFGASVAVDDTGHRVVVGAPMDDEKWEDAGQVFWFDLTDENTWTEFVSNKLHGREEGSNLGRHVVTNFDGIIMASGGRDRTVEKFPNAGVVEVWGLDREHYDVGQIGYPVVGTHEGARFGYDLDLGDSGEMIIASGENREGFAGSVRVFTLETGAFQMHGNELMGPELGDKSWKGKGPSVAVASRHLRVAIGYECIMSNGLSRSEVRVFDYFAVKN